MAASSFTPPLRCRARVSAATASSRAAAQQMWGANTDPAPDAVPTMDGFIINCACAPGGVGLPHVRALCAAWVHEYCVGNEEWGGRVRDKR